jgi:hypothetical protein
VTTYNFSQLESIWTQAASGTQYATPAWASLMAAIGLAESSGNASATNPNDNNGTQTSYGIWQISNGTHAAPSSNWANPTANAQLAIQKLQSQGLGAWGTYTSGAYAGNLPTGSTLPPGVTGAAGTGGAAGGATGAQTTGLSGNPITWLTAPVKGLEWAGNWVTGGALGSITTEAQGLAGITQGLGGLVSTMSKVGQLWLTLFRPQFWLRVGAFFVGLITLFWGFHFLKAAL